MLINFCKKKHNSDFIISLSLAQFSDKNATKCCASLIIFSQYTDISNKFLLNNMFYILEYK